MKALIFTILRTFAFILNEKRSRLLFITICCVSVSLTWLLMTLFAGLLPDSLLIRILYLSVASVISFYVIMGLCIRIIWNLVISFLRKNLLITSVLPTQDNRYKFQFTISKTIFPKAFSGNIPLKVFVNEFKYASIVYDDFVPPSIAEICLTKSLDYYEKEIVIPSRQGSRS